MSTLAEMIAQRDALTKQIEERQQTERLDVIAKIKEIMASYGITTDDIAGGKRTAKAKGKVAAKYRDPETGREWSGRGLAPKWMQGKDKSQFLIA